MISKSVQHLSVIKEQDQWETPTNDFIEACVDFHIKPKIDVCATNASKKCDLYFGPDHEFPAFRNGLKCFFNQDFFMNPPYSEIEKWIPHAIDQIVPGVHGLVLTYNKTDTKWWHSYIENNPHVKVHFVKGRIRFLLHGKPSKHSAPYPSVWLVLK